MTLADDFGDIDIYLFDQLLKGRIGARDKVLDAGCGSGRNLIYLLKSGIDVSAVDSNPQAVTEAQVLAAKWAPGLPATQFRVEPVEQLSFPDASFSVVLSSAVLHFARDDAQFDGMVREMWRVLRAGGMLFAAWQPRSGWNPGFGRWETAGFTCPTGPPGIWPTRPSFST